MSASAASGSIPPPSQGGGEGDNNSSTTTPVVNTAAASAADNATNVNPSSPTIASTTTSTPAEAPSVSSNLSCEQPENSTNQPAVASAVPPSVVVAAAAPSSSVTSSTTSLNTSVPRINPFEVSSASTAASTTVASASAAAPSAVVAPVSTSAISSAAAAASTTAAAPVDRGILATASTGSGTMSVESLSTGAGAGAAGGPLASSSQSVGSPERSIQAPPPTTTISTSTPSSPQQMARPVVAATNIAQQQQQTLSPMPPQQPQVQQARRSHLPAQPSRDAQNAPPQPQNAAVINTSTRVLQQPQQPSSTPTSPEGRPISATTTGAVQPGATAPSLPQQPSQGVPGTVGTSASAAPLPNRLVVQHQHQAPLVFDDDENTEPSSAINSAGHVSNEEQQANMAGKFAHFIETTRRRLGSGTLGGGIGGPHRGNDGTGDSLDDDNDDDRRRRFRSISAGGDPTSDEEGGGYNDGGALICGYLKKLGRNGKWQTRWFETDGECLSYYKNNKRTKLLATLDLEKVGAITIDQEDQKGHSFSIQVLGRLYHLRADNKAACKDWVITLNRIKEAHLQQGNVKLVPTYNSNTMQNAPVDLLDTQESHDFVAPRVVVVANRQRTRAVAESQDFDQIIQLREEAENPAAPAASTQLYGSGEKRLSTVGAVVLTRWTKRRSSLNRLSSKLRKWARSLRHMNCAHNVSAVGLDKHVHPPGHDDAATAARARAARSSIESNTRDNSGVDRGADRWIAKEASIVSVGGGSRSSEEVMVPPEPSSTANDAHPARPRRMSSASEDIRVLS